MNGTSSEIFKNTQYHEHNCLKISPLPFAPFIMTQISESNAISIQVTKIIKKPPSIKVESFFMSIFYLNQT